MKPEDKIMPGITYKGIYLNENQVVAMLGHLETVEAEYEKLTADKEKLIKCVEFYGEWEKSSCLMPPDCTRSFLEADQGKLARTTLAEIKGEV